MNRRLMWSVGAGGVLLVGGIGLAIVMAEPTKGPVFIAGDQPVTEDQVRQSRNLTAGPTYKSVATVGIWKQPVRKTGKPARWKWIRRLVGSAPMTTTMMTTNETAARRLDDKTRSAMS